MHAFPQANWKKFMSMAKCKAYFQYEWTRALGGKFQDKKSVFLPMMLLC